MEFIHPFDDPDVISGQGGVGLELLSQVPDLARVVVPVGGGGLISGISRGDQVAAPGGGGHRRPGRGLCAVHRLARGRRAGGSRFVRTIADGIAVKRPGRSR